MLFLGLVKSVCLECAGAGLEGQRHFSESDPEKDHNLGELDVDATDQFPDVRNRVQKRGVFAWKNIQTEKEHTPHSLHSFLWGSPNHQAAASTQTQGLVELSTIFQFFWKKR